MRTVLYLALILLSSCTSSKDFQPEVIVAGSTSMEVKFLTIGNDTIQVINGQFSDTLQRDGDQYDYLKLDSWKWPRIVYLKVEQPTLLHFEDEWVSLADDPFNEFLLNKDSILIPYSARWDMTDPAFRAAWQEEMPINFAKIDSFFQSSSTPSSLIDELKQMEYMLRGHLTANFISFQEKKGQQIDRNIYDFVEHIDLNNERLAFHVNNRNFQYYYYLDQVSDTLPDSIYPFAAVDTLHKYITIADIRNMIITSVVRSGLYDEAVDHEALFKLYEENIGALSDDDKIVQLYAQIQKLKPGNPAPEFGTLLSKNGEHMTMEDLKGKNILISAWGTWCPYCKEELPHLKNLLQQYPDQFESVAISLDTDAEKWANYIQENKWEGTHLIDPDRNSAFKKNYLISGTNIYYLIDKEGEIIAAHIRPSDHQLAGLIQELE